MAKDEPYQVKVVIHRCRTGSGSESFTILQFSPLPCFRGRDGADPGSQGLCRLPELPGMPRAILPAL